MFILVTTPAEKSPKVLINLSKVKEIRESEGADGRVYTAIHYGRGETTYAVESFNTIVNMLRLMGMN
jgi:hypothetical protein